MINFTVGPVQSSERIRKIGSEQVPYFRTPEFSELMKQNEEMILSYTHAPEGARAVFITGSGTASMEAVVMHTLSKNDKVLVINGGSFGQRFVDILTLHRIPFTEIKKKAGERLTEADLAPFENQGYSAFLVNIHETSTGVYYDRNLIKDFCRKNALYLIVDAISSFLADPFDMEAMGADIMITGSQKALACPPGISIVVMSKKALQRIEENPVKSYYLDLKSALKNGERGQTPFTPAVGTLIQIHDRLLEIGENGGVEGEQRRIHELAEYFRDRIKDLPFEIVSESLSNAVTPLHPQTASAKEIFKILKDEYNIWICPNGGEMAEKIFRVGHIGDLKKEDYDRLIEAFEDLQMRGII